VDYVDFEIDNQRQTIIDEVGKVAGTQRGFVHIGIAGRAGIGKTRLALEVVRANGLEYDTFYALSPSAIPSHLFSHVEATLFLIN
jgi:predicted ATP-dependent serine protease